LDGYRSGEEKEGPSVKNGSATLWLRLSRQRLAADPSQRVRIPQAKANNKTTIQTKSRMRQTLKTRCSVLKRLAELACVTFYFNKKFAPKQGVFHKEFNGTRKPFLEKVKT
jgi:hypothetical protein